MSVMTSSHPLVSAGSPISAFSGAVTSRKRRATVSTTARDRRVDVELSARGARLLGILLEASAEDVAAVEELLETHRAELRREGGRNLAAALGRRISPNEAAEILGVSRPTVVRWAAEGLLTDHLVGAHHRFALAEVLALAQSRTRQAAGRREAAAVVRADLQDAGVDLDVAPTTAEMVAAGVAARGGDHSAVREVFARQRRQDARRASLAAGDPDAS